MPNQRSWSVALVNERLFNVLGRDEQIIGGCELSKLALQLASVVSMVVVGRKVDAHGDGFPRRVFVGPSRVRARRFPKRRNSELPRDLESPQAACRPTVHEIHFAMDSPKNSCGAPVVIPVRSMHTNRTMR